MPVCSPYSAGNSRYPSETVTSWLVPLHFSASWDSVPRGQHFSDPQFLNVVPWRGFYGNNGGQRWTVVPLPASENDSARVILVPCLPHGAFEMFEFKVMS